MFNPNYLADYHVHSSISPDANCTMVDMAQAAYEKGIKEIVFTDHYEFFTSRPPNNHFDQEYLAEYFRQLILCQKKYQGKIKVLAGVEFGQMHLEQDKAHQLVEQYPFDYIIGSVHKINNVDLSNQRYTQDSVREITKKYYQYLNEMAKNEDYDCIGHLNLVSRYSIRSGILETDERYEDEIKEILNIVIQRGKGIEINTSGLRQKLGTTLPSERILIWYYELGGTILTLGSDAHRSKDLAAGFEQAVTMLSEIGFTKITYFEQRQHKQRSLIG